MYQLMGLPGYIQIKLPNLDLKGTNQDQVLTAAFAKNVFGAKQYVIQFSCLLQMHGFNYLEFILFW